MTRCRASGLTSSRKLPHGRLTNRRHCLQKVVDTATRFVIIRHVASDYGDNEKAKEKIEMASPHLNKVQLIGRVGTDPEVRSLPNGTKVAKFRLATSEQYKDKSGEKQEKTEWHSIVIWGNLADVVEKYVNKGDLLYLEGKVQTEQWDDKESGEKKYRTVINTFALQMLGGSGDKQQQKTGNSGGGAKKSAPRGAQSQPVNDDDLPF
jgi:single-strand DNA-binding protein